MNAAAIGRVSKISGMYEGISDRVAMVHSGRIICVGSVDEFQASDDQRVRDFIEGRAPVKESVEALLSS